MVSRVAGPLDNLLLELDVEGGRLVDGEPGLRRRAHARRVGRLAEVAA